MKKITTCTGTRGDYMRHLAKGETPCIESLEANRLYSAQYRAISQGVQKRYRRLYYARTGK